MTSKKDFETEKYIHIIHGPNVADNSLAPKAWLNRGLLGCKAGWTNQTFLVFKPGLPDFTRCAKSLVNQGIPGKPGYPKNQENQTLTRLLKF